MVETDRTADDLLEALPPGLSGHGRAMRTNAVPVILEPFEFPALPQGETPAARSGSSTIRLRVVLGRVRIPCGQSLPHPGSKFLPLDALEQDPVEIWSEDRLIAVAGLHRVGGKLAVVVNRAEASVGRLPPSQVRGPERSAPGGPPC